ncbi:MAG: hypothetical protein E7105_06415 [Prevotella sp.]|nr:hypothetical protein [Prevotella sp.]
MKKTYIAPQLAVFRTSPATIIALSDPNVGIDKNSSIDADLVDVKASGDWDIWGSDDGDYDY